MITINHLNKTFGKVQVLKDISLDIPHGQTLAILGPNGSGKTTLIKSILGMVIPDSGNISWNEIPVIRQWKYREMISYLPQIARFPENLKVKELIQLIRDIRPGAIREQELIDLFGLNEFINKKLGHLSGGTRQKVNLVLTFMYDSPFFILDEPTSGLDPVAVIKLKDMLVRERKNGKSVIFTTHILQLVEELAEKIIFLLEGNIYFEGSLKELRERTGGKDLEESMAILLTEKS